MLKTYIYSTFARDNIPWVTFCLILAGITYLLTFYVPSDNSAFCAADDKSVGVCIRNWIGPIGNLIVALVAMAAAIFAYKQCKATDSQAASANLNFLERRLEKITFFHKFGNDVRNLLYTINQQVNNLVSKYQAGVHFSAIQEKCAEIYELTQNLDTTRRDYGKVWKDISIDSDVREVAENLGLVSDLASQQPLRVLLSTIADISKTSGVPSMEQDSIAKLSRDLAAYYEKSNIELRQRGERISYYVRQYEELARNITDRRMKILGLEKATISDPYLDL